tara:strand:- start:29798 stop:30115 length:318 start_codon:yes stop_codon:yes gene_type:complete
MLSAKLRDFGSSQPAALYGLQFRRSSLLVLRAHELILQSALRFGGGLRFSLRLSERGGGLDRSARRCVSVILQLPNISPRGSASRNRLELRSRSDLLVRAFEGRL